MYVCMCINRERTMTITWHAKLSILRVVNVIIRTMRLFIPLSSTRQFQSLPHPRLLPGRPFSIDTGTDYPEGQMDDSPPVADQSAFPTNAPFSTWISPNNFGDFHPNPLMSLFTGNGQIEYPVEAVGAVSRIHLSKRQRAQFRAAIPIILLVMDLEIHVSALPPFQIRIRRRCR